MRVNHLPHPLLCHTYARTRSLSFLQIFLTNIKKFLILHSTYTQLIERLGKSTVHNFDDIWTIYGKQCST